MMNFNQKYLKYVENKFLLRFYRDRIFSKLNKYIKIKIGDIEVTFPRFLNRIALFFAVFRLT
jgi:hypothetical protein